MNTNQQMREAVATEARQEAEALAREIIALLGQKPRRTTVVLESLTELLRVTALQLPPNGIAQAAMVIGQLAGDLFQASLAPQSAPAGAAIH